MADSALQIYGQEEGTTKKSLTVKEQVARWHDRITVSKKQNEEHADQSGNTRFIKEYKGESGLTFQSRNGSIKIPPVNFVFAYVQSDMASTYNRDPYITVNPKGGTVKSAKLKEVLVNAKWRELGVKEEVELEIIDKDLVGLAWHKVGHSMESEGEGETLKIKKDDIYSLRVDWQDIFWNLGSMRPPIDCAWMAQRIIRPLEDVKEKFPNARNLEGTTHPMISSKDYRSTIRDLTYKDDIKVAIIYEIWDRKSRQIYTIAEGLKDQYLEDPKPWPEYLDEFPFLMYWDFAIPGEPRPMSAIAPWEAQMLEFTTLLAQTVNHAKRWNRQLFLEQGMIDGNSLDKFERGDDGAIIEVNGKMENRYEFVDFGQLPTDFYMIMDRLTALMNEINGQPAFDRGGVTKTNTRTVGELQQMKTGAKGRTDRKIDRLETHLENIARHMIACMMANFDMEQAIKITGDTPEEVVEALGENFDPQTGMVKFTPEEIQDLDFEVEVKAGSTLPLDKETRMQTLEIVLNNLAAVAGQSVMSPFMVEIITEMLDQFDIKGLKEAYAKMVADAQKAAAEQEDQQDTEEIKDLADAEKRRAQSQQIQAQTQIAVQQEEDRPFKEVMEWRLEAEKNKQKKEDKSAV